MYTHVDALLKYAAAARQEKDQTSLFLDAFPQIKLPNFRKMLDWQPLERLAHEFDAIGFFLTAHPLDQYKTFLKKQHIRTIFDLKEHNESTSCKVAGVITAYQERNTKKGNKMAFVQISDPTGLFEVTFFSEALTQAREFMSIGNTVLIDAECQIQEGEVRLLANHITSLDASLSSKQRSFDVTLKHEKSIDDMKSILDHAQAGKSLFTFYLSLNQNLIVKLKWPAKLAITPEIMQQLKALEDVSIKEC